MTAVFDRGPDWPSRRWIDGTARERTEYLVSARAAVQAASDPERALTTLAEVLVPAVADWSAVDLLEEDGSAIRAAVTHADPSRQPLLDRLLGPWVPGDVPCSAIAKALTAGRTALLARADPADLCQSKDPEHLALREEGTPHVTAWVVPCMGHGLQHWPAGLATLRVALTAPVVAEPVAPSIPEDDDCPVPTPQKTFNIPQGPP